MALTTQQKREKKVLNDISQQRDSRVKLWDFITAQIAAVVAGDAGGSYSKPDTGIPATDLADDLSSAVALAGQVIQTLGGLFLKFDDIADGSSAAAVTAAVAGAKQKIINVSLVDGNDVLQTWFTGAAINLSSEVTCNDVNIGDPSLGPNPVSLVAGLGAFTITYATDEGATRVYIPTDMVHVFVDEDDAPTIFGEVVDVTGADFLDTLVA